MTTVFADHLLGPDTHANRPAATAVPAGTLYSCSDHSLIYQSDGATWSTWATLGTASPGAPFVDEIIRTSNAGGTSHYAISSTAWADVDATNLEMVIPASVGDVIEFSLGAYIGTVATAPGLAIDVATYVSGAVVNRIGGSTGFGVIPWYRDGGSSPPAEAIGGSWFYTVQAGDLDGGNVTCRLQAKTSTSVARNIQASAATPMQWAAVNHG